MSSSYLSMRIRQLALHLHIEALVSGRELSLGEAEKQAAREIARKSKPSLPSNATGQGAHALLGRLLHLAAAGKPGADASLMHLFAWRFFGREDAAPPDPTPQESAPQPSIVERVVNALTRPEPEPAPEQPASPPEPVVDIDPTRPFVQSGYGGNAELIPNSEFRPAFRESIATQNWKASITDNVLRFDERRGRPPSKSRYIG
jgi:hypothetical protein